jgi:hypothetical protein
VGEVNLSRHKLHFPVGPATPEALLEVRRAVSVLGREFRQLSTGPARYPAGEVHFYDTDMFQRRLAAHLRAHKAQDKIRLDAKIPDKVRIRFGPRRKQPFTIADYLSIPAKTLARETGRSAIEIRRERLHKVLGGLTGNQQRPGRPKGRRKKHGN